MFHCLSNVVALPTDSIVLGVVLLFSRGSVPRCLPVVFVSHLAKRCGQFRADRMRYDAQKRLQPRIHAYTPVCMEYPRLFAIDSNHIEQSLVELLITICETLPSSLNRIL